MDIRTIVLKELKRQGRTRYWLAWRAEKTCQKCGAVKDDFGPSCKVNFVCEKCGNREPVANATTIYRFLAGTQDASASLVGFMLGELGMRIHNGKVKKAAKLVKA